MEPLVPGSVVDGGPVKLLNQMSRNDYKKVHNHFGTIGRISNKSESQYKDYEQELIKNSNLLTAAKGSKNRGSLVGSEQRISSSVSAQRSHGKNAQRYRSGRNNKVSIEMDKEKQTEYRIKWHDSNNPYMDQ